MTACCPCAEQEMWDQARTIADLGELTARWLERDISFNPRYTAGAERGPRPPEDETAPHVPVLAALNRAGFTTKFSHPGRVECREPSFTSFCPSLGDIEPRTIVWKHDERDRWQRAAVTGYMAPESDYAVRRLRTLCEDAGLAVSVWKGSCYEHVENEIVPVSFVGARTPNPAGEDDFIRPIIRTEVRLTRRRIRESWPDGVWTAMDSAWYVMVSDPEIGRNDRLWPALDSWINERKSKDVTAHD